MSLFGLKEKKEIERLKKLLTPEHYTLGDINQEIEAKRKILDELCKQIEVSHELIDLNKELVSKKEAVERILQETDSLKELSQQEEEKISLARKQQEKAEKAAATALKKAEKARGLIKAIEQAQLSFDYNETIEKTDISKQIDELLSPEVTLDLNCLNMKDLRKRYRQNEKDIEATLERYKGRYNTKANQTIYQLMVIALSSELQNILYTLRYGKLEDALKKVNEMTFKYLEIASQGNQSIVSTLKKFIGEINYFYQEAVRIEYEYFVQKERAKEEQRAIREQMKQEAEERKELERQQKKVEKEESKFVEQIEKINQQIAENQEDEQLQTLKERLAQLEAQLKAVSEKKDEIVKLQNGKAGNVYIISNIGSFGENVYKIGMTRRLDPQDRVNELGNASVPFPFDVHSFIFSDDAVGLEGHLHKVLNDKRVNKVNLRKEFFKVSLDELEKLVEEIAPTAEFKRTILAEQYRQSLSIDHLEDVVMVNDIDDLEDDLI